MSKATERREKATADFYEYVYAGEYRNAAWSLMSLTDATVLSVQEGIPAIEECLLTLVSGERSTEQAGLIFHGHQVDAIGYYIQGETGAEFSRSEVIALIKWLEERHGVEVIKDLPADELAGWIVQIVEQETEYQVID